MFEALRAALDDLFTTRGLQSRAGGVYRRKRAQCETAATAGVRAHRRRRRYLYINGAWRDHVLVALTNPRFDDARLGGPAVAERR